jgi:hypothetical protein
MTSIKERFRHVMESSKRRKLSEPSSLEDLAGRLRRDEITELSLGWRDSDFLKRYRSAVILDKAIQRNNRCHTSSSLTKVSIGWRHMPGEGLVRLLYSIARNTKLRELRLVLDDWIPAQTLNFLLKKQGDLVVLDLQAVYVRNKEGMTMSSSSSTSSIKWDDANSSPHCSSGGMRKYSSSNRTSHKPSLSVTAQQPNLPHTHYDHCVVRSCVVHHLLHLERLKVLNLTECDLTDRDAIALADFIYIRGGLSILSLRNNRRLTHAGLRILAQAPVMQRLDLSLCDLIPEDAQALAMGIASRPWPIHQLWLAGNYQMGSMGLLAMASNPQCLEKVAELDLSYCDSKAYQAVLVLNALTRSLEPNSTLRKIAIQGSCVGNDAVAEALANLLAKNTSLRSIRLDDHQAPKPMNAEQLRIILQGVQNNYELEELSLDKPSSGANHAESLAWNEINFLLRLNAAGRRLLVTKDKPREYSGFSMPPPDDWFQVLAKAGDCDNELTVLYWMVRHGADRFAAMRKCRPN